MAFDNAAATIGIPERFEVHHDGSLYRIQWRWPRLIGLALTVFAVAWDAFLISWYAPLLGQEAAPPMMLFFPMPHVAVGLVLPYVALAFLLNSTFVEIESGELRVRHRPVPFPGRRTLRVADLRQLFCVERAGRKGAVTYEVMARLATDRETRLVGGLSSDREARFIEQRIERQLGLIDRPVAGGL